jgi:hypothetical protein
VVEVAVEAAVEVEVEEVVAGDMPGRRPTSSE